MSGRERKLIRDSLGALAKAKFQLDKIQRTKPYLLEYRIIDEMMIQVRDNLVQMLGPGDEESE